MMMSLSNLLGAAHQGFVFPIEASTVASDIDGVTWFIHWITIFFTGLIVVLTAYFAWKYRASAHPVAEPPGHNNVLEVVWTVIPAIIVFICFFWGFRVYMRMTTYQPDAVPIDALGQMWAWSYQYRSPVGGPDIKTQDLFMPVNQPVEFTLRSSDVIHSLYLPAMRVKRDVVPGRFNKMYVTATVINRPFPKKAAAPNEPFNPATDWDDDAKAAKGEFAGKVMKNDDGRFVNADGELLGGFDVYCTEYCGDLHSRMLSKLYVLPPDQYTEELVRRADPLKDPDTQKVLPLEIAGKNVAQLNGCTSCHSANKEKGVGPTWRDVYGAKNHPMANGTSVTVDDAYIVESIRNPNAKVRAGYSMPSAMNAFSPSTLPDDHVKALIEYMKSISANAPKGAGQPAQQPATMPAGQPAGDFRP